MRVRFWGARGSLATPGAATVRYGGNTSCAEVTTPGGSLIIIDCGTGMRQLGEHLVATKPPPISGHILISHTHWDHIQGIPFFAPLFVAGNTWDIYAPKGMSQSLREALEGQMQYAYFPVQLSELGAQIRYHELVEGTFAIADATIRTRYLNHPALTFGYRLEAGGAAMVYASDHEPHSRHLGDGIGDISGEDLRHCEFLADADLVIHDAQYTADEYPQRIGWGHSTVEYAIAVCRAAGVKKLALTHHDPARDDDAIDRIVSEARANPAVASSSLEVMAAREGTTLDVEGSGRPAANEVLSTAPAIVDAPALSNPLLLLAVADRSIAEVLLDAASADQIPVVEAQSADAVLRAASETAPSLIVLEQRRGSADAVELCAKLRSLPAATDVPIIIVADAEAQAGEDAGVTDWLLRPFSSSYARSRIRAWLMRSPARWERAPLPLDEEQRLAALQSLQVLDTPNEHRFDRLTRLAAGVLGAPMALVSLVDRERQWFKSAHGVEVRQTSRETSFCAHAVAAREPLVVSDAFEDARFADNPIVTGMMRIRFYAGIPLFIGQSCIGTLCVMDARPRRVSSEQIGLLKEIAGLVERELQLKAPT